jgi:hypothetical protein
MDSTDLYAEGGGGADAPDRYGKAASSVRYAARAGNVRVAFLASGSSSITIPGCVRPSRDSSKDRAV